jgi:hypothetical protein
VFFHRIPFHITISCIPMPLSHTMHFVLPCPPFAFPFQHKLRRPKSPCPCSFLTPTIFQSQSIAPCVGGILLVPRNRPELGCPSQFDRSVGRENGSSPLCSLDGAGERSGQTLWRQESAHGAEGGADM